MLKRIDHVELIPLDLERTLRFYTDVLGFGVRARQTVGMPPLREVVYLELGGTVVELMGVDNPASAPQGEWVAGYRAIALEVDDMDRAVAELAAKGVKPSWGPVSLGPSKRAEIEDPDGFPIELRQW